jgi:hypothetical protein
MPVRGASTSDGATRIRRFNLSTGSVAADGRREALAAGRSVIAAGGLLFAFPGLPHPGLPQS